MDGSESEPDAEALIRAVNEAMNADVTAAAVFMQVLYSWYSCAITAGFAEQRAFDLILAAYLHILSRQPAPGGSASSAS